MVRSVAADLLELRKRRVVWILGALLVLAIVLFGYAIIYFVVVNRPQNVEITGSVQELKESLLPANLVPYLLSFFPQLGGPIALILGALAVGSEYGWGTLKTLFTQDSVRLRVFGSKMIAVGVVLLALVLLAFVFAAVGSVTVAQLEAATIRWPSFPQVVRGVGAAWLILATWTALGVALAVIFRGTALAIGLGLVYALLLENVIGQLADLTGALGSVSSLSDVLESIHSALPGVNAGELAASFDGSPDRAAGAVIALLAYVLVFFLLAALLFRQREVT